MSKLVNKTVPTTLVGVNGNAFAIMGHFQREARRAGWTKEEIDLVLTEAKSSDYDHLLSTIMEYCDEPSDDSELDDEDGDHRELYFEDEL